MSHIEALVDAVVETDRKARDADRLAKEARAYADRNNRILAPGIGAELAQQAAVAEDTAKCLHAMREEARRLLQNARAAEAQAAADLLVFTRLDGAITLRTRLEHGDLNATLEHESGVVVPLPDNEAVVLLRLCDPKHAPTPCRAIGRSDPRSAAEAPSLVALDELADGGYGAPIWGDRQTRKIVNVLRERLDATWVFKELVQTRVGRAGGVWLSHAVRVEHAVDGDPPGERP